MTAARTIPAGIAHIRQSRPAGGTYKTVNDCTCKTVKTEVEGGTAGGTYKTVKASCSKKWKVVVYDGSENDTCHQPLRPPHFHPAHF